MKIFLSGQSNIDEALIRDRLYSYFYEGLKTDAITPKLREAFRVNQCVLLDSGAFSAFNSKVQIPLERFASFCVKHQQNFHLIASLDVIGDAVASMENYERLRDAGATVFPTFHYGEPTEFLEKMKRMSDVIGIGGVAQLGGGKKLLNWMDTVWSRLVDSSGKPTHRVHGFAVTAPSLITRFPWYSVDSMSWLFSASNGSVCVFDGRRLFNVVVSDTSSAVKDLGGMHYNTLSAAEKKVLHDYIDACGETFEECKIGHGPRQRIAAISYARLAEIAGNKLGSFQMTLGE